MCPRGLYVGVDLGMLPCLVRSYGAPHKPNVARRVRHSQCSILGNLDVLWSNPEVR